MKAQGGALRPMLFLALKATILAHVARSNDIRTWNDTTAKFLT